MIGAPIDADNLPEYYEKLCDLHTKHHKPEYILVHDEIRQRLVGCESYTEMGVNQGATLAAAMLQHISCIRAYDFRLLPYLPAQHIFKEYATTHSIDYDIFEIDTRKCSIDRTDVLYIDTAHLYEQLSEELRLHADKAQKYIICHDTHSEPDLKKAVNEFVANNTNWSIVTDCTINVGFMTIKRT